MLLLKGNPGYYEVMFYDAFALSNFRVVSLKFTQTGGHIRLDFIPSRPTNNPTAFANPEKFNTQYPPNFSDAFLTDDPIVFFTFANEYNIFRAINFFNYLRANYPDCKIVCWLTNPVHYYQTEQKIFLDKESTTEILSTFDCVLTYNQVDAIDYGLTYFEGPYSVLPYERQEETVDIFFIGRPKDRLKKILCAYKSFKEAGFTCDFYINEIENPPAIQSEGLHFNNYLSYFKVLQKVLCSRGILDITHRGNYGLSMRYFESLAYNKNFITDNAFYRQDRFASPKLFLIDKSFEIDKEKFMNAAKLSSNYRNEYSPLRMITFLELVLNS